MLPARLTPSTSPARCEWRLSSPVLNVLTRIRGHDAEWQPSPVMQVRSLSCSEAISRVSVQKHLYTNDGTGDGGLQMRSVGIRCWQHVRWIQHTAVTAYRLQASVCDGRDITAESTMPRDGCWEGLVKTLRGRFRST